MVTKKYYLVIACFLLLFQASFAQQVDTRLVIRAQAHDAKFIGSMMGGVAVTIKKSDTGKILDRGTIRGNTGDTRTLMMEPVERYEKLSSRGAAKYATTVLLEEPTKVTIIAEGPLAQPQAAAKVTKEIWLIPGKHIEGDGIILNIHGFVVDIVSSSAPDADNINEDGIPVTAKIVMMCGCPTSDGGMWDSSEFSIKALVSKDGEKLGEFPLSFTGKTSTFEGTFNPDEPGTYDLTIYAFDPRTGNSGVDKTSIVVK